MNHKLLALVLCGIAAGAVSMRAQTATTTTTTTAPAPATTAAPAAAPAAPAAPSLSFTLTPAYVSTYMFRGQRLGGQSFEPSIEADYGNLAIGVWANDPISNKDKVPGQSDPEIDPYGSYTFNVTDAFSIQPGFTWYTYVKAPLDQGYYRMTFEPNLALNYTVQGVKLTPKIYYDVILHEVTYEFDAAYTVPLKQLGTELDFLGTVGTYKGTDVVNNGSAVNPPATKAWGNYWLAGVTLPFQLNSATKLSVGWAYTAGSGAYFKTDHQPKVTNTEAVGRGVATVSLAFTF